MVDTETSPEKQLIVELAQQQTELYRRQGLELVSHHNREKSALDGYRGRQLLELVQNADDAGVEANQDCSLLFDISRDRLVVANTGGSFTRKGLTSLVISDCSPKQMDRNRFIGCKGLGFRSILAWTNRPLISSGRYEVVFDHDRAIDTVRQMTMEIPEVDEIVTQFVQSEGRWPVAIMRFPFIPDVQDCWLKTARGYRDQGFDTAIVIPLSAGVTGDTAYVEICDQLRNLPKSSLLFCRKLTWVKIMGDMEQTWNILREPHTQEHMTVFIEDNGHTELWEVHRRAGKVPTEIADLHSEGRLDFEIAVAVPETPGSPPDRSICVFFPTQETLPCSLVIHATLETTDDRNHLVDHPSNREVLRQLASYVGEVLEKQPTAEDPRLGLELLSGVEKASQQLQSLGFVESLVKECAQRSIFPGLDGKLRSGADVRQPPHDVWLERVGKEIFPEILVVNPQEDISAVTKLFSLTWFDVSTLKERLRQQLSLVGRRHAGEILGSLLAAKQLNEVGADGLLIGEQGRLVENTTCFFTPSEKLPDLPSWASSVQFVDKEFQNGLMSGFNTASLRFLGMSLKLVKCEVDEYGFEPVARSLITQVETGIEADSEAMKCRWRELLHWLIDACGAERQALTRLNVKVITSNGTLRRATTCYLGPSYRKGQIVWGLYHVFNQDEFVGTASDIGLGDLAVPDTDKVEQFLLDLGVAATPRLESLTLGVDYVAFRETVIDRLSYPRTIRGYPLCFTRRCTYPFPRLRDRRIARTGALDTDTGK